ncbi:MAG: L-aspartate oxidase [Terriglobia bacterium]
MTSAVGVRQESKTDFLVIGGGIAGLRAAIDLAAAGSVLLVSKGGLAQSAARDAHGGITVASGEDEGITLHLHETLRAGDGLCRQEAARILVEEGPREIRRLTGWGARLQTRAPAHPAPHGKCAPSPRGEPAGAGILHTLRAKAKSLNPVRVASHATVAGLLMDGRAVCGATYLDEEGGKLKTACAAAVMLATGGLGQVYAETTNPPESCGAGVGLAFRAGGLLSDMEFIQFHPTVLYTRKSPRPVLPEALRERGAQLRNLELERFMFRYHEAGELAPADVVSRAILMEMQRSHSEFVYLDLTSLSQEDLRRAFPRTYADCLESNIDIASDLVPVRPAAHFASGGLVTDLMCSTTLQGLYAAGETAATGVHGANCFANNSLLEGLVYGARAAAAMKSGLGPVPWPKGLPHPAEAVLQDEAEDGAPASQAELEAAAVDIRQVMWNSAGIIRSDERLRDAANRLKAIRLQPSTKLSRLYCETRNLLDVARLIVMCALERKESRGAHYRADFPLRDDSEPARHSFIARGSPVLFRSYDSSAAPPLRRLTAAS